MQAKGVASVTTQSFLLEVKTCRFSRLSLLSLSAINNAEYSCKLLQIRLKIDAGSMDAAEISDESKVD
jgi:hypothetical protein